MIAQCACFHAAHCDGAAVGIGLAGVVEQVRHVACAHKADTSALHNLTEDTVIETCCNGQNPAGAAWHPSLQVLICTHIECCFRSFNMFPKLYVPEALPFV